MDRAFPLLGVVLLAALACAPSGTPAAPSRPAAATAPAAAAPASAPAASNPAAPAAPAAAARPEPVTINFAHPVISSQFWHLFIGKDKGLYADEAINLESVFVAAGNPAIAQGTVGGAYEIASNSGDVLVTAVEQGAPLAIMAVEVHKPSFGIIV